MISNPADLAESTAPLSEDERAALHAYWDQVLDEVWGVSALAVANDVDRALGVVLVLGTRSSVQTSVVSGEAA